MVKRVALVLGALVVVGALIESPDSALTLVFVLAGLALWGLIIIGLPFLLRAGWRRGARATGIRDTLDYLAEPHRRGPGTLPPPPAAGANCPMEKDKIVFRTRSEAQQAVQRSARYAAGQVETPLDHEYQCPYYDHWHVSSQARRW